MEEESFRLGNTVELGNEGFPLCLFFGSIIRLLSSSCLVLEELDKGTMYRVSRILSSLDLGNSRVKSRLLQGCIRSKGGCDRGGGFLHQSSLGLFSNRGFFSLNHGKNLFHLNFEIMLGLDGTGSVKVGIGSLTHFVDFFKVLNHVLVGLKGLQLLFQGFNDLILNFIVFLEKVLGLLVQRLVNGIPRLSVDGDAKGNEHSHKLCLLIDNIPFVFDERNGSRHTNREGKPFGKSSSQQSALGSGLNGLGFLLLSCRSMEKFHTRSRTFWESS
mmetsp:Transcript_443/g.663  ORF Transcript_443/g.663 Transcript_443/m.663 type:complete len:272 (+) Transcript_443:179-994(+)